jgi:hypothetical protein
VRTGEFQKLVEEKGRSNAGACPILATGGLSDSPLGRPSKARSPAISALAPAAKVRNSREAQRLARRIRSRFIIARGMELGGDRPAVDVVVPFFGPRASLERLVAARATA